MGRRLGHGPEVVVIEETVELREVDVRDPQIAADKLHVLVVRVGQSPADVR